MSTTQLLISAGTGPAEVCAFVAKLRDRMIDLLAADNVYIAHIVHQGPPGAPRSATIVLSDAAPAWLSEQVGTHALIDPSRGAHARKRWFVKVAVTTVRHSKSPQGAGPRELQITHCRAGGPGGQHVNKVATAVRAIHLPSGIQVKASAARSQKQNLAEAKRFIASKLDEARQSAMAESRAITRTQHYRLERGAAVATYTLDARGLLAARKC
jgi:protein subunit release factor B